VTDGSAVVNLFPERSWEGACAAVAVSISLGEGMARAVGIEGINPDLISAVTATCSVRETSTQDAVMIR